MPPSNLSFPSLDDILDIPALDQAGSDLNPSGARQFHRDYIFNILLILSLVGAYEDYIGWAMAMFDYDAGDSDELSFRVPYWTLISYF